MKKIPIPAFIAIVVLYVVCVSLTAYADDKPKYTKHFNESLFDISPKGLYSVELLMDDKEYHKLGKDVIGLVVHDSRDRDVEAASISINEIPENSSNTTKPVIAEKGDGLYTVKNLDLSRGGKWELKITVRKNNSEDSVSFMFPGVLNTRLHKGRYLAD